MSREKVVLLQVGEDLTGSGVLSLLIAPDDLAARRFERCTFEWGQT